MKDRWSLIALAVMMGGLVLVGYALLTPTELGGGGHMGETFTRTGYQLLNLVLAVIGTAMAAGSATFLLARGATVVLPAPAPPAVTPAPSAVPSVPVPPAPNDDTRLILRLLGGDERDVFRSLVEAGGEQLQRDIVEVTKLSDAKVSRVLDRLEEKGLVARERRGMGNVVRIAVDRAS
jgi:uncharacterized membrane protein